MNKFNALALCTALAVLAAALVGCANPYNDSGGDTQTPEDEQYAKAIAGYTAALKLEPDNAALYNDRGFVHFSNNEYDKAIADYSQAIRLEPKNKEYYLSRACMYFWYSAVYLNGYFLDYLPVDKKRIIEYYDRAIEDYTQAIKLYPEPYNDSLSYQGRAEIYLELKDYDKAIADYEALIKMFPDDTHYKESLEEAKKYKYASSN